MALSDADVQKQVRKTKRTPQSRKQVSGLKLLYLFGYLLLKRDSSCQTVGGQDVVRSLASFIDMVLCSMSSIAYLLVYCVPLFILNPHSALI